MKSDENRHHMNTSYRISVQVISGLGDFWNPRIASKVRTIILLTFFQKYFDTQKLSCFLLKCQIQFFSDEDTNKKSSFSHDGLVCFYIFVL